MEGFARDLFGVLWVSGLERHSEALWKKVPGLKLQATCLGKHQHMADFSNHFRSKIRWFPLRG